MKKTKLLFVLCILATVLLSNSCRTLSENQGSQSSIKQVEEGKCQNVGASAGVKIRDVPKDGATLATIPYQASAKFVCRQDLPGELGWLGIQFYNTSGFAREDFFKCEDVDFTTSCSNFDAGIDPNSPPPPLNPTAPPTPNLGSSSGLRHISFGTVNGTLALSQVGDEFPAEPMPIFINGVGYRGKIKNRGGLSRRFPKKSLSIKFEKPRPEFFGKKVKELAMNASWVDPTFMRSWLVLETIQSLGGFGPKHEFVTMNVQAANGQGGRSLYIAQFHPNDHITELADEAYKDAHIVKAQDHSNWDNPGAHTYEIKTDHTNFNELSAMFQRHCRGEKPVNHNDFIIFNLVNHYFGNQDTFTKNFYLFSNANFATSNDVRIYNWDADLSTGLRFCGDCSPTGVEYSSSAVSDFKEDGHGWGICFDQAIANKKEYYAKYKSLMENQLHYNTIFPKIDAIAAKIRSAASADIQIWGQNRYDSKYIYDDRDPTTGEQLKFPRQGQPVFEEQVLILKASLKDRLHRIFDHVSQRAQ